MVPSPESAQSFEEFHEALVSLYRSVGAPSLQELDQLARDTIGFGIAPMALHELLSGRRKDLVSLEHLYALVTGCYVFRDRKRFRAEELYRWGRHRWRLEIALRDPLPVMAEQVADLLPPALRVAGTEPEPRETPQPRRDWWRALPLVMALVAVAVAVGLGALFGSALTHRTNLGAADLSALITSGAAGITCLVAAAQMIINARTARRSEKKQEERTPTDVATCYIEAYRRTTAVSRPRPRAREVISVIEEVSGTSITTRIFGNSQRDNYKSRHDVDLILAKARALALERLAPDTYRRWLSGRNGLRFRPGARRDFHQVRQYIEHLRDILDNIPSPTPTPAGEGSPTARNGAARDRGASGSS